MKSIWVMRHREDGFGTVEFMVAAVIFSMTVISLMNVYFGIERAYSLAREMNEIYTVLSACPEVDRAIEFNAISSTTNCYPNNSFPREDGGSGTITYSPNLTVTPTSSLAAGDPLSTVPDSKVIDISVGFQPPFAAAPPIELKILITRNGIAQS